ncbi:hypothetical protein [Wolbachia endosymbiont (group B) of Endotricha flammealis]|uniref:hypothetical protein n=1 Tax=Wolbachia endosymbiont (group B) of Endotricha flammealis TaxID=2954005 RepID=UPI00222EC587|nr:hypothetical protein [Wolbachia endosymbiont (group B) of Endotricha flammealis]
MYSLSLRPGNSPLSYDNVVGRLQHFGFPPCCYPSYRIPTFILVGLSPTEQYSPSLDALSTEKIVANNEQPRSFMSYVSPPSSLSAINQQVVGYLR